MGYYILAALLAYLISSINPSLMLGKYFFKRDLRDYGSNNPGASNAFYVYGAVAGASVFVMDALKGYISVFLANHLFSSYVSDFRLLLFTASFFAVLGHCKSIFLKFSGGKGFATFLGVCLYQFPAITGIMLVVFILAILISKYITVGTFTLITLFPAIQLYLNTQRHHLSLPAIVMMLATSLLILYQHRKNIVKLRNGTEISIRTPRINPKDLK